jgi:putative DNA primase/helicase
MSSERVVPFDRTPSDPPPDGLILNPDDPIKSARAWLNRTNSVGKTWHRGGVFFRYTSPGYKAVEDAKLRADIYAFLERTVRETKAGRVVPFQPTRAKVDLVIDALRALCHFAASTPAPCWLNQSTLDPTECVALQNGILHIPTRRLLIPTPEFFTLNVLPFAYDANAPAPARWLRFNDQLWPDEPEPIATLQEFIGYLLTAHTRYQKILMLVGPKRSGKGTIGRVIRQLLGAGNVCSPTLGTIGGNFGRTSLIGKTAAIIADARISGRTDTAAVTECLLSISGEDPQSIPRKFLPDWDGTLGVRFVLMTNELPKIEDASGALASRFLIIPLTESWFGREDVAVFLTGPSTVGRVSVSVAVSFRHQPAHAWCRNSKTSARLSARSCASAAPFDPARPFRSPRSSKRGKAGARTAGATIQAPCRCSGAISPRSFRG